MRLLAVTAFLALVLAGCSGGNGDDKPAANPNNPEGLPMLHGFVFDPALRPLAGATVKVLDSNASTTTDAEGFFGFDGLPVEQFLVVVATLDTFTPSSKQVTLPMDLPVRLNFTLQPVPTLVPYSNVLKQEMIVECEASFVLQDQTNSANCGTGTQGVDQFDIAVDQNLAGAVIEIFWTPTTALAESMGAKLETLDLGQLNLVLGQAVGKSPLRITVPETTAQRYYPQGGMMKLTVFAEPNADENEAGVGASILVQQPLTAYASLFYVAPPDPSYSIGDSA